MTAMLDRREFVAALLGRRGNAVVVSSLGNPSWDVAAAGDSEANFYLWGAMGGAAAMGLGLALARPDRRVAVIAGDGEMLMGLTNLATIAAERPANLGVLVLDNGTFAETGSQPGLTSRGVSLAALASAAGFSPVLDIGRMDEMDAAAMALFEAPGPSFVRARIEPGEQDRVLPERNGEWLARRTRKYLEDD
jgi:thiamine pyrophosphate-dependent acetolactate synthase large subunit-like protein